MYRCAVTAMVTTTVISVTASAQFGSVARGDDRAHSDADFLVDMDPDRSLLDIVGLGQEVEALRDRKVD